LYVLVQSTNPCIGNSCEITGVSDHSDVHRLSWAPHSDWAWDILVYPIIMSMPPEIEEAKPLYHPLFDDDEADIILSSNDHTLFCLSSITLRKSLSYFCNQIQSSESTSPSQQPHSWLPFPTLSIDHVLCLISALPLLNNFCFKK